MASACVAYSCTTPALIDPVTTNAATTTTASSGPAATTDPPNPTESTVTTENPPCELISDFEADTERWRALNDGVMGGRSDGGPEFSDGIMVFSGSINTDGGGFSSARAALDSGVLAGTDRVRITARTDGRSYRLLLRDNTERADDRISHQVEIPFKATDEWQVATVRYADLRSTIFGREIETGPFVPGEAELIGIQLADGVDGPFRLEVDRIEACEPDGGSSQIG